MVQYSGSPLLPGPFEDGVFTPPDDEDDEDDIDDKDEEQMSPSHSTSTSNFYNSLFKNPFDDLEESGIELSGRVL